MLLGTRLTIVHGGQTGVDRGAHEAAIRNGWQVTGYMPRDQHDELGRIPPDVARFLLPHGKPSYAARTEANVGMSAGVLIIVRDVTAPRETPGTAKTLDLATKRRLPQMVVDPGVDPDLLVQWILYALRQRGTLELQLSLSPFWVCESPQPRPPKLLIAGPRESKWLGACAATVELLQKVASAPVGLFGTYM